MRQQQRVVSSKFDKDIEGINWDSCYLCRLSVKGQVVEYFRFCG